MRRFSFKDRKGEACRRTSGEIDGQCFILEDLKDCEVTLCDHSDQVTADNLDGCRIFVGASGESVFIRNCVNCEFTVACKQLRTRDCQNCVVHLYSKTEPIIETSSAMTFRCFNGAYAAHAEHLHKANLPADLNLWFAVFDFNDEARTGANWSLEDPGAAGLAYWRPLGDAAEPAVPYTSPGAVPVPSKEGTGGGSATQSFGIGALQAGASAPAPAPAGAVGWNPHRAAAAAGAAGAAPPAPAPAATSAPKVGWNPQRAAQAASAGACTDGKVGWNPNRKAAAVAAAAPAAAPAAALAARTIDWATYLARGVADPTPRA